MTAQQLYDELGELIRTYRAGDREVIAVGYIQRVRISKAGDSGWVSSTRKLIIIETERETEDG